jgi:hypothetical protein
MPGDENKVDYSVMDRPEVKSFMDKNAREGGNSDCPQCHGRGSVRTWRECGGGYRSYYDTPCGEDSFHDNTSER